MIAEKILNSPVSRALIHLGVAVRRVKVALLAVMLFLILFDAILQHAHAAPVAKPDYKAAYNYALKCFVAGGISIPKAENDPDGSETARINALARKSYDAVYFMGKKLGYVEKRISADLDHAQGMESRLMIQNSDYYERAKANCVRLGLM